MLILKIFRPEEWAALRRDGATAGAPVDVADGFIHFSTPEQAPATAAKHFAGADGLVLVGVEADGLGDALRWERSRGGALFPHLHRELHLSEVARVQPLPLAGGVHVFPEDLIGHVDPERPQFELFKGLDRDQPVEMLNLVALRAHAAYPAGHDLAGAGLTGAEAYRRYAQETAPILARLGARIVWRGAMQAMLVGPMTETWDHVFVARYPTAHAFLDMVTDPAYRQAVLHRQAAVRTSRLIRCAPAAPGEAFA
jgi:uncharacterized protein (DUF952 family)/uncharacterized protein (DUF1330 family)